MSNSEGSPHKKSKVESPPLSWLPDDVVLECLARVSRLELAALSLASKSYRSLVASPDLYKMRSLMGRTETYVYVCLRPPPPDSNPRWYILRRRDASSDLIPIPWLPSQPPEESSVVVLDWGIYVIGGLLKGKKRTSDVWLLDCRTHTWHHVPSMGVARASAAAGVVDGKIYVLGGCQFDDYSLSWGEVFDPKTQTWDFLPQMPVRKRHDQYIHDCVVRDQKVYAVDETYRTLYYSPSEGRWGRGNRGQLIGNPRDWCMIDNLIFCLSKIGTIFWCEPDELDWREPEGMMDTTEVKGLSLLKSVFLSRLVPFGAQIVDRWDQIQINEIKCGITRRKRMLEEFLPGARLSNSGGNIVLFWDVIQKDRLEIWCAEISLERRQGGEIWGNIEWSNPVMTVDPFLDRYKTTGEPLSMTSSFSLQLLLLEVEKILLLFFLALQMHIELF